MGFDELNVLTVTRELYDGLKRDNREVFLELAQERYQETEPRGEEPPDLTWLLLLLAAYNRVTKVIYDNEADRKQQYTAEGINSSAAKAAEFQRGLRYWADFTAVEADHVTDEATLKAYTDAGVEYVRWRTAGDEKVCDVCRARDNKIYPIDSIPDKPHKRCRCTWVPVRKNANS